MIPSKFDYYSPATLQEALSLLSEYGDDAKVLAGGQSLVSLLKLRLASPRCLVDLGSIGNLSYIHEDGADNLLIGAMTRYAEIAESKLIAEKCPLLRQTALVVGDVQVRNRGTLGGSLAHADPAGDMPAAILALKADLKATGPKRDRWIKSEDFFLGMYATALEANEILTEVRVPVLNDRQSAYLKAARRPSDFAMVGIAVCLKRAKNGTCEDVGLGVTGITDKPYRPQHVEAKLRGQKLDPAAIGAVAQSITEGIDVNGNIHASPEFRAHLAGVYLSRAIQAAIGS
ncbi:MAG: xanthine dehydrogenase family protein subunit M [Acidobacteria bacterium]|nr:xanthine dehydrogenase family protein subunit M [Acidobacteriota bacterium]